MYQLLNVDWYLKSLGGPKIKVLAFDELARYLEVGLNSRAKRRCKQGCEGAHEACCMCVVVLKNTGWGVAGLWLNQEPRPAHRGCGGPAECPWA